MSAVAGWHKKGSDPLATSGDEMMKVSDMEEVDLVRATTLVRRMVTSEEADDMLEMLGLWAM